MKFYVKNEHGVLIRATREQVADPTVQLFDENGQPVKLDDETPNAPAVQLSGAIQELTGLVKELATRTNGIKEKQEQLEQQQAAFKEAAKRGFPIPGAGQDPGTTDEEMKEIFAPYDLAMQGKEFQRRMKREYGYDVPEEKRVLMAKWFILFLKAGFQQDQQALVKMREMFGTGRTSKTALGDAGNVFPIPDIVDEEIFHFQRERSVILANARIWPMTSEKQSFPQEQAGVTTGWGNTTSQSDPTIGEVELDAEELSAYSVVKNTTLADARSDIVSWLTDVMAEAAGLALDDAAFNGDGSSNYAQCEGLLSSHGSYYSVTMGAGSTAFSNLNADHLSEMISKLDGLKKQNARFWLHGAILHFIRSLKDSQSRPIFIETVGAPMSGTIWGYPYTEVIKAPSTSAANRAFMVFGNMRFFAVGRRLEATALAVDPYGLWTTNRTRFKIYQRWGLVVALPKGFCRMLTHS